MTQQERERCFQKSIIKQTNIKDVYWNTYILNILISKECYNILSKTEHRNNGAAYTFFKNVDFVMQETKKEKGTLSRQLVNVDAKKKKKI